MRKRYRIVPICLPLLLAVSETVLATTERTASNVPPGFEDIALGQVEHLDIRLLGASLGVFPVFVRPDDVRLETPEALAHAIESRFGVDADVASGATLVDALARPMLRNGHLACGAAAAKTGCRYLETASTDVIFDESQGVLDLFVAKAWIPSQTAGDGLHHANSPGSEPALIHSQIVNASTSDRYRNLTLMGNGALGISPASYAGFAWSLVHAGQRSADRTASTSNRILASVDSLYYRHDLGPTYYAQIGRMDQRNLFSAQGGSFGFTLLPVERFDGARFGTSRAYVNDAAVAQGSALTVLLTREARVDAYRGSELLGSAYLAAGVQQFDTRYFPEGAYLVTLRIFEGDTLVRTQSEPYTKVGGGAYGAGTQWFVQGGKTVNRRQSGNTGPGTQATVQSGVRTSFGPGLTFATGLVWLPSRGYNETQVGWQHAFALGRLTTTASLLTGTDGARGNTQSVSFANGIGLSIFRYQMRDATCRRGARSSTLGDVGFGCYDSLNASVSLPLNKWQGSAGYSESRTYGRGSTNVAWPQEDEFWQGGRERAGASKTLQATLSRSFRWDKYSISARFGGFHRRHPDMARADIGGFVNLSLSAHRPAKADSTMSTFSAAGVDVRTGSGADRRVTTDYHASHSWTWDDTSRRELTVGATGTDGRMGTASLRGAMDGRYGDVNAMISRSFGHAGAGRSTGSLTAGYASSFAVSGDGVWFGPAMLAGEPPAGVGLAVDAGEGAGQESGGAAATLEVGGRPLTVDFGASALVPVSGYRAHHGEVSESRSGAGDHSVGLLRGAGSQAYFLTPGRMKVHRVTAGRSYTYVGRALGPDGFSLANARVLSVAATPLDDRGEFMIESPHPLTELYLLDGGQAMRCDIRNAERRDVIYLSGVTQCDVVAQDALPAPLQAQSRVRRMLSAAPHGQTPQAAVATMVTGEEGG